MVTPAILVTARRRAEEYPKWVHYLGYDDSHKFLGYYSYNKEQQSVVEVEYNGESPNTPEDEEVTPEKIVESLSSLIEERNSLKKRLDNTESKASVTKKYKLEFEFFGEPEEVWELTSEEQAKRFIKSNVDKFGEKRVQNVKIIPYGITYDV